MSQNSIGQLVNNGKNNEMRSEKCEIIVIISWFKNQKRPINY